MTSALRLISAFVRFDAEVVRVTARLASKFKIVFYFHQIYLLFFRPLSHYQVKRKSAGRTVAVDLYYNKEKKPER